MRTIFDIDIDTSPVTQKSEYGISAMIYNEDQERIAPHPSGIYLENVPMDDFTGLCAFDYKYGNDNGFMKVDLLHNSVYSNFKSKAEIYDALEHDIRWELFLDESVVTTLPHLAKHYNIVSKLKPKSVMDLSDILAIIRPGKIELLPEYIKNKERTRARLYKRPRQGMYFKKSHAVSYAMMIVCLVYKKYQVGTIDW
ncbi:MAG: hypothetical protein PF440_03060 [Thiomicrorhabdus sp.]|jgi:hypothetical protein|nr:hypothetical protein [Thiomicrorhabdus sp.]